MIEFTQQDLSQLTELLSGRLDDDLSDPPALIDFLGEGMYSVAFKAMIGEVPFTMRLIKHNGPNDNLAMKRGNFDKEENASHLMHERGSATALRVLMDVQLRKVLYTGPKENDLSTFWEEPISFKGYNFIGFQISEYIKGLALSRINNLRGDAAFVASIGQQIGAALALAHQSMIGLSFPRHSTNVERAVDHHQYRFDVLKPKALAERPDADPVLRNVAGLVYKQWGPIYDSNPVETPVFGDLSMNNLIVDLSTQRLSGIVDFDKCTYGDPRYDFRAVTVIPGALLPAVASYEAVRRELTGNKSVLDVEKILTASLGVYTCSADGLPFGQNAEAFGNYGRALNVTGMSIILDQLAEIKPEAYAKPARAVRELAAQHQEKFSNHNLRHYVL